MGHTTSNRFHSASEVINQSPLPNFVILHLSLPPPKLQRAMRLSRIVVIVCSYIILLVSATNSSIEAATDEQPSERSVDSSDVSINSDSIYTTGAYPATQISSSPLPSPSVSPVANLTAPITSASSGWSRILHLVR